MQNSCPLPQVFPVYGLMIAMVPVSSGRSGGDEMNTSPAGDCGAVPGREVLAVQQLRRLPFGISPSASPTPK
jgi:hypothetical protein